MNRLLLTGEISVDGKIFGPYERNLSNTFPLNGKTFCRVSNFFVDTLQNGGRRNSARNWMRHARREKFPME